MNKPTLLVLAAGMGSRYGSLKQMDVVGPNKEAILDYSIFDAIRAGFGKVVFVIRHSFEKDFREVFNAERFGGKVEVDFVFQELENLPDGYSVPEGREKPWGTNHAIMMAENAIKETFAVINADDFYGAEAYQKIATYLRSIEGQSEKYSMVGYFLKNTLSDHGSVSRGVCEIDNNGKFVSMTERTSIEKKGDRVVYTENEVDYPLSEDSYVSMNLFGFTPDYFERSKGHFKAFLNEDTGNLKSEFSLPFVVDKLVTSGVAELKVLSTTSQWFGVTYKDDKPSVVAKIQTLIAEGKYPEKLWG